MKITTTDKHNLQLEEVYIPIILKTSDGEEMSICMRDTGFEFTYQGEQYSAQGGVVTKIVPRLEEHRLTEVSTSNGPIIDLENQEVMNMYAIEGHKVYVSNKTANNGYGGKSDLLEIGVLYTVEHTSVGQSNTDICLKEFPNKSFNSVNFCDAVVQSEEDDMKHRDWKMWNEPF